MLTTSIALLAAAALGSAPRQGSAGARVFELEDTPAPRFAALDASRRRVAPVDAVPERPPGLRGVPELVAEEPLFGAVPLGGAEAPGGWLYFAVDKRKPTARRYDRLYLDLDRDGDLSDEEERRTWEEFELALEPGDGLGARTVELKPRVRTDRDERTTLTLYFTRVKRGEVEVGHARLEVALAPDPQLSGRFDLPGCHLVLRPPSSPSLEEGLEEEVEGAGPSWFPSEDRLGSGRLIGGEYYVFSAAPDGSRLTVTP